MRLASYSIGGKLSFGIVRDDGIVDIPSVSGGGAASLRAWLAAGGVPSLADFAANRSNFALGDVRFAPPIPDPEHVFCIGLNYKAHAAEAGLVPPADPSVFARVNTSLVGHEQAMEKTRLSEQFDYEGELAVIIGRAGRHISRSSALDHVAGYSCFNDGSVRDYQRHSVTAGKNFPRTGGFGPWMVTAEEIEDPGTLELTTRLNGQVVQHSSTRDLIQDIPTLIAYLSSITTLLPGDVIATGTPEGVGLGRKPPLWMKAGDVVEVEIEHVGCLRNLIEAER